MNAKLTLSLTIDLSNECHLAIMTALLQECGKAKIDCITTPISTKSEPTTKAAKTVDEPKAKTKRSTSTADYSTTFDLTLEKDGIHLTGKHSANAYRTASAKLRGDEFKLTYDKTTYAYYVATKAGKVDVKATKAVFDNLGGKLHITNEDYKRS